jgi:hypothetical protein
MEVRLFKKTSKYDEILSVRLAGQIEFHNVADAILISLHLALPSDSYRTSVCKSNMDAGRASWDWMVLAGFRNLFHQTAGGVSENDSYRRYVCKSNKDAESASWPRFGRAEKRKN